MKMQAVLNGTVVAESDNTVVVEGNHYFPEDSIRHEHFTASDLKTTCHWKGVASYYSVEAGGHRSNDAAWYYPDPKDAASQIRGRVAFWKDIKVEPAPGHEDAARAPEFDTPDGAVC